MNVVATAATPAQIQARMDLRRSNAATSIPAKKIRRQGSRATAKRAAIRDYR